MNDLGFAAMGTDWWVRADLPTQSLAAVPGRVEAEEARFSRFRATSALSRLNTCGYAVDSTLAAVIRLALQFQAATAGAFNPRLGACLRAAGYDRSFAALRDGAGAGGRAAGGQGAVATISPPPGDGEIVAAGDTTVLIGAGEIDLGGIVKGWMVDQIAEYLESCGATGYLVDGGGDIRVGSGPDGPPWPLGVGETRAVTLRAGAVATSSTRQRRWRTAEGPAHHIIDGRSGAPAATGVEWATVVASHAATADALATALIANPDAALPALGRFAAEALIFRAGAWWRTPGFAALEAR